MNKKMLDELKKIADQSLRWIDVGVHPTPDALALTFGVVVAEWIAEDKVFTQKTELRVLDACCGDGRLGHAVAAQLVELGYAVKLSFVDVDEGVSTLVSKSDLYSTEVLCANFFTHQFAVDFDLVVSNPPYQAINRVEAESYGFAWSDVSAAGRNLYGLSIKRCIDVCKTRGVVALIAPHGWLGNEFYGDLRRFVASNVSSVDIDAFSRRSIFPGVSQDTAFQRLVIDKPDGGSHGSKAFIEEKKLSVNLGFDQGAPQNVLMPHYVRATPAETAPFSVRVGPFVWNRQREWLHAKTKTAIVVINGPNIGKSGELDLSEPRAKDRQYVRASGPPSGYITQSPFIILKRTMRGSPGKWVVDASLVQDVGFRCVAENHTILVELMVETFQPLLVEIYSGLPARVVQLHALHGHPNLSVALVRQAVEELASELSQSQ